MAADPLTTSTVDDLLLQDAAFDTDDDPFADKPPRNAERDDKPTLSPRKRKSDDENPFGTTANIDEEVKITKPRKKIPKLDTDRLLSEPGIPKMRKILRSGDLKKKLRLKGKGHEFSDTARLLNYYQMWLDQLYPRAKFADALQMVEKAGHTKKLQMYRKSWIDEGKPGYVRREDVEQAVDMQDAVQIEPSAPASVQVRDAPEQEVEEDPAAMFFADGSGHDEQDVGGPDEDELDALLAQGEEVPTKATSKPTAEPDSEGEDDLDALLAQQDTHRPKPTPIGEDEDELDALMEQHNAATSKPREELKQQAQEVEEEDDDELDAILNDDPQTAPADQPTTIPNRTSSSNHFVLDDDTDDFDALLAQQETAPEPELPPMGMNNHPFTSKPRPHDREQTYPSTEEVPELDSNPVSSSPVPNVRTDELDDLMDAHDATVEKQKEVEVDSEIVGGFLSSSPIPNRESQ